MKKIFKILTGIVVFILFLVLLVFALFKFFPEKMSALILPHIKNVRMDASQNGNGKMDLNIHANINESIIPYFLDSLQYKAVLYGDTISKGIKDFKNAGDASLSLPMTLNYKKLVKLMKNHQGDSAMVRMVIRPYIHLPFIGQKKFEFNKDLKLRMIVFPEVKIEKVDVEHFGFKNMVLKVRFKIFNPNNNSINIPGMKYTMSIDRYFDTRGESKKNLFLKANGTSDFVLEINSAMHKPMKAVWEALKGKEMWPYKMNSDMVVQTDLKKEDKMKFSIALKGEINTGKIKK